MLQRFILPVADVGSGIKPASGAQLFFYEPGTTTPKITYTDVNGIFPSANPVVANSLGVFDSIFLSGTYRVILKDKNGSQIWEEAGVQYDYTFDSASEAALAEFSADGAAIVAKFESDADAAIIAATDSFEANGSAAINAFNNNGDAAINTFNLNSDEAITDAIESVLQSIDGVVSPGVNQDFGFIAQPVTQILDYGSLA